MALAAQSQARAHCDGSGRSRPGDEHRSPRRPVLVQSAAESPEQSEQATQRGAAPVELGTTAGASGEEATRPAREAGLTGAWERQPDLRREVLLHQRAPPAS